MATCLGAESLDINEWLSLKERFLEQQQRSEENHYYYGPDAPEPKPSEEVITFAELLSALPPADQWDALISAQQSAMQEGEAGEITTLENQLILATLQYLAATDGKREQLAKSLDAVRQQWEETKPTSDDRQQQYAWQMIDQQLQRAINELRGVQGNNGQDSLERLQKRLDEMTPMSREELAESVGGEENLAKIDAFIAESKAMQEKYAELFMGDEEPSEEAMAEYQKQSQKLLEDNQEVVTLVQMLSQTQAGRRYLYGGAMGEASQVQTIQLEEDLLTKNDEETVRAVLRRAYGLPVLVQSWNKDLQELAREVAMEQIEELQTPQWSLVQSAEDKEFFEAMLERFPVEKPTESGYNPAYNAYQEALKHYAKALLLEGDIIAAREVLLEIEDNIYWGYDMQKQLAKSPEAQSAWKMLHDLVRAYPEREYWNLYYSFTEELDKEKAAYELVSSLAGREPMPMNRAFRAYQIYARHLMEEDDLEGAKAVYREARTLLAENIDNGKLIMEDYYDSPTIARECLELGMVLGDAELQQIALDMLGRSIQPYRKLPKAAQADEESQDVKQAGNEGLNVESFGSGSDHFNFRVNPLIDAYLELDDYAAAEQTALADFDFLEQALERFPASDERQRYNRREVMDGAADVMQGYVAALYGQERYGDIVQLLGNSPYWNAADLSEYLSRHSSYDLPARIAYALHQSNQTEIAVKLLERELLRDDEDDQLYEVYVAIKGEDAIPYLDYLSSINRFQERPLIWKAQALLDSGRVAEAEPIILEAISMDPSDGDQGKGDRMRAYAVLGDVRTAQGNNQEAEFFDEVLRSIRISEDADDYYAAGLHEEAIAMYEEALTHFYDAYCIQSRLAVKLMDEGREEEAAEHYAKAFELMPDSFGRIESHCFGCEGAFRGEMAQTIAEQVFQDAIKKDPKDPQAHYLMAYLRMEEERYEEALPYLETALELDPDYLNAWKKMEGLADDVDLSPEKKDHIARRLLELDPLRKHTYADIDQVYDHAAMWPIFVETAKLRAAYDEDVTYYPLTASAKQLDESSQSHRYSRFEDEDSPGEMLLQDNALRSIGALIMLTPQVNQQ